MERIETPRWMQDKRFTVMLFCEDFLAAHPMVCVSGSFFTVDDRISDEENIRKQIYETLRPHFSCSLAKRVTGLVEMLKLEAYAPDLPLHADRIHEANGTLFLGGTCVLSIGIPQIIMRNSLRMGISDIFFYCLLY